MEDWKLDQRYACTANVGMRERRGVGVHMHLTRQRPRSEDCAQQKDTELFLI